MTSYVFSISILCLAAMNNEQLRAAPQELLSMKIQEQFAGNFQRIRRILLRETRKQRTILREVAEQPRRFDCRSTSDAPRPLPVPELHVSYPHLLVSSSRPIRAPSA